MEASDRFQGLCLIEMAGSETIEAFDRLPPYARELVRNSSFNLCAACVAEQAMPLNDYKFAIQRMEAMIRCEEVK